MIKLQVMSPPLNEYVHSIYEVKGKPVLGCERIFARNGVEIHFNLGDPVEGWSASDQSFRIFNNCQIVGSRTSYFDYKPFPEIHLCSIRFTSNGFYNLFNIGQNDFGNSVYLFESLFPKNANFLIEELHSKASTQERFDLLQRWIKKLYRSKLDKSHYIVSYLIDKIQTNPSITIKELEKESGFSRKHLFKCFKNETGISPKQFQRITRFNYVIQNIQTNPNWLDHSYELDFYDQSHLIKEVKHFSGVSPSQLLKSPISGSGGVIPVQREWR